MTREEIDAFCKTCSRKRKQNQECMLESVCKDCKKLYDCIGFCVAEMKEEAEKNDEL